MKDDVLRNSEENRKKRQGDKEENVTKYLDLSRLSFSKLIPTNHHEIYKSTEWMRCKATHADCLVLKQGTSMQPWVVFSHILGISNIRNYSASQGKSVPFFDHQRLLNKLKGKRLFFMLKQHFFYFILHPLLLVLSLSTTEQTGAVCFALPSGTSTRRWEIPELFSPSSSASSLSSSSDYSSPSPLISLWPFSGHLYPSCTGEPELVTVFQMSHQCQEGINHLPWLASTTIPSSPRYHSPTLLQGRIAGSCSTRWTGLPGPFLQSCSPGSQTLFCTSRQDYSSPSAGFCISLRWASQGSSPLISPACPDPSEWQHELCDLSNTPTALLRAYTVPPCSYHYQR